MFFGSSLFLSLIFSTNNLFLAIYMIIGMSICFYVLLAINSKFGELAREAGIKYFLLSALSSGLILGGIKELYAASGTAHFNALNDFYVLLISDEYVFTQIFAVKYAMLFVFAGFLFKLSAAPYHFWAPEVYEGLPFSLISFIVLPIKFAIGFLFLRILKTIFTVFAFNEFDNLVINSEIEVFIIITVIFSMLVGGLNAMYEQKIKRFIAYSSINQVGFLFVGLLGTNSSIQGIQAFIYFFVTYLLNLTLFLNVVLFFTKFNYFLQNVEDKTMLKNNSLLNLTYLTDFQKIFKTAFYEILQKDVFFSLNQKKEINIYLLILVLVLFSLAGIPPLVGFFGKFYVLLYAFKLKYFIIVALGIIVSIISVYYYLRLLKIIFFEELIIKEQAYIAFTEKFVLVKQSTSFLKSFIFFILIFFCLIMPLFVDTFILQQTFELTQSCFILMT
jgi:NADH:ubiquinone oxidoreductase subunit 2 (subunit N)